jgi:hypothetical protein
MAKPYKVQVRVVGEWEDIPMWQGLNKGTAKGIMMAMDAIYGTPLFRMMCEEDEVVIREAGGKIRIGVDNKETAPSCLSCEHGTPSNTWCFLGPVKMRECMDNSRCHFLRKESF